MISAETRYWPALLSQMINARARLLGPHRYHLSPAKSVVVNEHRSNLPFDSGTISEVLSPRQLFKITTFQLPFKAEKTTRRI